MVKHIIKYSNTKHGYVRIKDGNTLALTVPICLKGNKQFEENLIKKGEQLLQRYNLKTQLIGIDDKKILLFSENIDREEFAKIHNISNNEESIQKTLRFILLEYIEPLVNDLSNKIGYKYKSITIKKLKSRRGSCSYDQKLVFNLNLVHLPTYMIQYVVVHEVCHLKVKNHSARFWTLVSKYSPQYKTIRRSMNNMILQ